MSEIDYDVEAIVRRKLVKNKLHYLVKWLNYPDSENSWEPAEALEENCAEIIGEFKDAQAHKIIACKQSQFGRIDYCVMWKDTMPFESFSSIEARRKWPRLVAQFLEEQLNIVLVKEVRIQTATTDPVEIENPLGNPIEITYVTDIGGLMYWTKYINGYKYIPSDEIKEFWPEILIKFLEQKLEFGTI